MTFETIKTDDPKAFPAWPNAEGLKEMESHSFTQIVNILQIDAALHGNILEGRIGNSTTVMKLSGKLATGDEGWRQKKAIAALFAEAIRVSLKSMGNLYKEFYERILADYNKNGLTHVTRKPA